MSRDDFCAALKLDLGILSASNLKRGGICVFFLVKRFPGDFSSQGEV
jgi:hypothetical protein